VMWSVAANIYFHAWFVGAFVGVLAPLCIAIGASKIASIAKGRRPLAYLAGALLLLLSPAAVAPAVYLSIEALELPEWVKVASAIIWAMVPDVSIVLAGAIVGAGLVSQSEGQSQASGGTAKKERRPKVAQRSVSCRYAEMGCDEKFSSQNAENAHRRWCKFKPLEIDQSLIIKKER